MRIRFGARRPGTRGARRLAAAFALLGFASAAPAAPPVVAVPFYDAGHFVQGLHRELMAPAAQRFAERVRELMTALHGHCDAGAAGSLADARARWGAAMEAWERLSAVAVGPLLERRSLRAIDFAPRPALIERALAAQPHGAEAMERVGTPAKGLPALEWLLWTRPAQRDTPACRYAVEVAADVGREADALAGEFGALAAHDWDGDESAAPAMAEALNQWLGGLERLRWANLERPLRAGAAAPALGGAGGAAGAGDGGDPSDAAGAPAAAGASDAAQPSRAAAGAAAAAGADDAANAIANGNAKANADANADADANAKAKAKAKAKEDANANGNDATGPAAAPADASGAASSRGADSAPSGRGESAAAFPRQASGRTAAAWAAEWSTLRALGRQEPGREPPPPGQGLVPFETYLRGRGLNPQADALRRAVDRADDALNGLTPASGPRLQAAAEALQDLARVVEGQVAPALDVSIGFSDADGD